MNYVELARQIVEGDASVDPNVMDYISDKIFDEDTQVEVIAKMCEESGFNTAEDFEAEMQMQLDEGFGPLLDMIGY